MKTNFILSILFCFGLILFSACPAGPKKGQPAQSEPGEEPVTISVPMQVLELAPLTAGLDSAKVTTVTSSGANTSFTNSSGETTLQLNYMDLVEISKNKFYDRKIRFIFPGHLQQFKAYLKKKPDAAEDDDDVISLGKVFKENGDPWAGVLVTNVQSGMTTITDTLGRYQLPLQASPPHILNFTKDRTSLILEYTIIQDTNKLEVYLDDSPTILSDSLPALGE